ncbi:MAG: helix-turn-helix domain-containing protein [Candidatus Adiutrix sp.]|jgi:plasmid maintenance system antidote protein VapI|nr:helix-turn-helix domain-containing protein [Candidatus Adiutrix sp.]
MRSINQTTIAKQAGIHRPYLCEILNGKKTMGRHVAVAIGRAFNLDPAELMFASPENLKAMLADAQEDRQTAAENASLTM